MRVNLKKQHVNVKLKKMYRLIYWVLKIISALLLLVPVILCLPGLMFHILSEEFDGLSFGDEMNEDNKND